MTQHLTIKLQIRIDPATHERLLHACKEWAPKDATYTPSDVVRLVLHERLPRLPDTHPATTELL
jgi:hypothetical protein